MNIVVGSAFRNATGLIPRYLNQVGALMKHAGNNHHVRVIAVEGDSRDKTWDFLATEAGSRGIDLQRVKCEHKGPWFGSTEAPERMKALSQVGNAILSSVITTDDVLLYVESDLIWDPFTVGTLIDLAMRREEDFDVFAPLIFAGPLFYDIWGFRKNGERFVGGHPYHIALENGKLCEVDSVGSCLTMRAEIARKCRIRNDYCLVGFCEDVRNHGYRIAVHPNLRVEHPC